MTTHPLDALTSPWCPLALAAIALVSGGWLVVRRRWADDGADHG